MSILTPNEVRDLLGPIPDGDPDELYDWMDEERDAIGDIGEEDMDLDDPAFPW